MLVSAGLLLLAAAAAQDGPPEDPPLYMHKHTIVNAAERGALCNDGTPATFYYRGCNETYYAKDDGGCVNLTQVWLVQFESTGEYCYDKESCLARKKAQPELVTASSIGKQVIDGLTQPYPESNPNFYKAHAVYVPYCSSDMWIGANTNDSAFGFQFNGRAIIKAVFEDLLTVTPSGHDDDGETEGALRFNLQSAERLIISGGPGIAAQAADIQGLLPGNLSVSAKLLCDGCALLDQAPLTPVSAADPCTSAADCPPQTAIKAGWDLWQATATPGCAFAASASEAYRCLLATGLLPSVTSLPMLVQHPLYDAAQLRALRAWPPTNVTGSAQAKYIAAFGEGVRAALLGTRYAFGAGCHLHGSGYTQVFEAYYHVVVNGLYMVGTLASVTPLFLNEPDRFQQDRFVDTCQGVDCNPSGCGTGVSAAAVEPVAVTDICSSEMFTQERCVRHHDTNGTCNWCHCAPQGVVVDPACFAPAAAAVLPGYCTCTNTTAVKQQ